MVSRTNLNSQVKIKPPSSSQIMRSEHLLMLVSLSADNLYPKYRRMRYGI